MSITTAWYALLCRLHGKTGVAQNVGFSAIDTVNDSWGRGGPIGKERRPRDPMDSIGRGSNPVRSTIIFFEFFRVKMLC